MNLDEILQKDKLTLDEMEYLLALKEKKDIQQLFAHAYEIKKMHVGNTVYLRGIIEFSNICQCDCLYCGIRKSNRNVTRFQISKEEILKEAQWIYRNGYGSLVLQAGERRDEEFIAFVENVLKEIKTIGDGALGVTISLGEQKRETYKRWFAAGAHRYLLRIETSNPELYRKIHPKEAFFDARIESLRYLKETGYQVGTGVMIGLPGQTANDLATDIMFFKDHDIDMIGMGPFIPHHDTPFADYAENFNSETQLELGLKMIAVTRIALKDINIAAATALQALKNDGRELGLKAGANIIMPNATAVEHRADYQLYDNKPCLDENSDQCRHCLARRIESCGENIAYKQWGDSPHFFARRHKKSTQSTEL